MQPNSNSNEEIGLYDQFRMGVYNSRIKSPIYTHYIWTQDLNTLKKLNIPKEVQEIRQQALRNRKNDKQTRSQYFESIKEDEISMGSSIPVRSMVNKASIATNFLTVPKRSKEEINTSRSHENLPPFQPTDTKPRNMQRNSKKPVSDSIDDLKSRVNKKRLTSLTSRLSNNLGVIDELSNKKTTPTAIKTAVSELTLDAKSKKLLDVDKHECVYTTLFKPPEMLSSHTRSKRDKFLDDVQSLREYMNPKLPAIPRSPDSPDTKPRNKAAKKKPENKHEQILAKLILELNSQSNPLRRKSVPFTLAKSISIY